MNLNNHACTDGVVGAFVYHNKSASSSVSAVAVYHKRLGQFKANARDVVHFKIAAGLLFQSVDVYFVLYGANLGLGFACGVANDIGASR